VLWARAPRLEHLRQRSKARLLQIRRKRCVCRYGKMVVRDDFADGELYAKARSLFFCRPACFFFKVFFLFEKGSTFVVLKTGEFLGPLLVRTSARRQNRSQNTVVLLSPLFSCFSPLFPRRLPTGVESVGLAEDDDVQTYCLLTWMRRAVSFLKC
jgi:hypothetical protein